MRTKSLIILLISLFLFGCKEDITKPNTKKEKVLKTNNVIFFSSDRDGKATNIYMMTLEGEVIKKVTNYDTGEFVATALSSNQLLFYQASGLGIDVGMYIYIYKIKEDTIIGPLTQGNPSNFTPDGQKFLYARHTVTLEVGYNSLYVFDLINGSEKKLTEDGKSYFFAQISPDGNYISYSTSYYWDSDSVNCWQLHFMDFEGNNIIDLTTKANGYYAGNDVFSPDGKNIIFSYNENSWCFDICKINIATKIIEYLTENRFTGRYDISSNYLNPSTSNNCVYFYSHFVYGDYPHPVEIYSINIDGSDFKQLTNNNFWDSHPIAGKVSYYIVE